VPVRASSYPVRFRPLDDPVRYVTGWARLESGVDRKAPLDRFYSQAAAGHRPRSRSSAARPAERLLEGGQDEVLALLAEMGIERQRELGAGGVLGAGE
jgi:hypothetical protein